jgi:hypothetical protein
LELIDNPNITVKHICSTSISISDTTILNTSPLLNLTKPNLSILFQGVTVMYLFRFNYPQYVTPNILCTFGIDNGLMDIYDGDSGGDLCNHQLLSLSLFVSLSLVYCVSVYLSLCLFVSLLLCLFFSMSLSLYLSISLCFLFCHFCLFLYYLNLELQIYTHLVLFYNFVSMSLCLSVSFSLFLYVAMSLFFFILFSAFFAIYLYILYLNLELQSYNHLVIFYTFSY